MTISDLILQLGKQTKHLEKTASALHTKNDAELKVRETELRSSLAKVKSAVDEKLDTDSKVVANRVAGLQRTLSDGFQAARTDESARGKIDAEDAIAVALHALQEAEYLLTAVAARDDADNAQNGGAQAGIDPGSEGDSAKKAPATTVAAKKVVVATHHDSSIGTKVSPKPLNEPTK
jgi:ribosomal protein RSM22 (predicted rRNA methylase)